MDNTPMLKDILTAEEFTKVDELRLDLLKSVTKWERKYYKEEIDKIFAEAKRRYYNENIASTN